MELLVGGGVTAGLVGVCAAADGYLDDVSAGLLGRLSDAEVLAELREVEALRRRWAVADYGLIAEVQRRSLPGRLVLGSASALLQGLLRLSPGEARQRVAAAGVCGPRWSVTGQPLPVLLPRVAAGQAGGVLSVEHARVIAAVMRELPAWTGPAEVALAEQELVAAAGQLRPREVGAVGRRVLGYLNPDGQLGSDAELSRRRSFQLVPQVDGSYRASGWLTPACGALLLAWLSPRSAPRPATPGDGRGPGTNRADQATDPPAAEEPARVGDSVDSDGAVETAGRTAEEETAQAGALAALHAVVQGGRDDRSPGQRMHDALHDLASIAVRRTELEDSGAPAQVIISLTAKQLTDRAGLAETSFGQQLSVPEALRLADEAAISLLLRDATGAVLNQGRLKRIATRTQTLALIARDKGCSFPGCDKPPEWCQRHHITAWADGGTTDLANLTLVCGHHHREFERAGWTCTMQDGLPTWTPPPWIDPHQKPRHNHRIKHELL